MGEPLNSKPTNTGDRCMHISSKGSYPHSIGTCYFRLGRWLIIYHELIITSVFVMYWSNM